MSSEDIVIDVRNLSKRYEIYGSPRDRLKQLVLPRLFHTANRIGTRLHLSKPRQTPSFFREFWALRNVSFQVRRGETIGIIGRNGSGKSTLLQLLAGTLSPTEGDVEVNGRVAALLELGSGFNPEFSGRENVLLNGRILGLTQKEIEDRYDQIVAFADIGDFIDQPVMTYSSGMFVRLAFAVQAHIDASIIIIDEALAVGDVFFRNKCYTRLQQLRESGAAILLVSHSMPDIEQYCERALLLDHGSPKFLGSSSEAAKRYYLLHQPNTQTQSVSPSTDLSDLSDVRAQTHEIEADLPMPNAYIDLSRKTQVSGGTVRCISVALCDVHGEPRINFRQGETAVFYYEFEADEPIGIPICGVLIKTERGVIVYGKNSWQFDNEIPAVQNGRTRIRCKHEIKLDLGVGEYIFEIGMASVTPQLWEQRRAVSHEIMTAESIRHCHVPTVGSFTVGLAIKDGVSVLTHHGIANLPGSLSITTRSAEK